MLNIVIYLDSFVDYNVPQMWGNLHICLQTFRERSSLCSLDEFRHRMILNNLQVPILPIRSQLDRKAISIYNFHSWKSNKFIAE